MWRFFVKEAFERKLFEIINQDKIKKDQPLRDYTTLHIGGNADYLIKPSTIDEIKDLLTFCRKEKINYYILGNGSNLLVSDKGYRGMIIHLGSQFSKVEIKDKGIVTAQSGVILPKLSKVIARAGLTGFEFAEGIPGTLGGAVTMNAGAYGGEIKQNISHARVLDRDGNLIRFNKDELLLGYRTSILQKEDYILLDASFEFDKGDIESIKSEMAKFNQARRDKQPIDRLSAGSAFKRPEGYFAGKLISDAELKGFRIGDISVSTKHSGFIINHGNGTAKEFLELRNHVIKVVEDKYGVTLEPEVQLLGDF